MDLARASLLSSYLCSHSRQTNQTCMCMRALLHHWCKCTYLCISISYMFKVRTMKTESWKNGPALQHDPFQQRCSRRRRRFPGNSSHVAWTWTYTSSGQVVGRCSRAPSARKPDLSVFDPSVRGVAVLKDPNTSRQTNTRPSFRRTANQRACSRSSPAIHLIGNFIALV